MTDETKIATDSEILISKLIKLGGYYDCPLDEEGSPKGPLVGYAKRDEKGRQLVGFTYLDCAVFEEHPFELQSITWQILAQAIIKQYLIKNSVKTSWGEIAFLGAPEGGKTIAAFLGSFFNPSRYIYPEKEVIEMKTETSREKTRLIWARHRVKEGEGVFIVEDLLNHFSTADEIIDLTEGAGGKVLAIVALANRSMNVEDVYETKNGKKIPVIAIIRKSIPSYNQDEPLVAEQVAAGNVIWKPKIERAKLRAAMEAAR